MNGKVSFSPPSPESTEVTGRDFTDEYFQCFLDDLLSELDALFRPFSPWTCPSFLLS